MRALLSVYDKSGLIDFARRLVAVGFEIVSSGGTAAGLEDGGVPVIRVGDVTGSPEILGGRVKTLHPTIHGGILARGADDDAELDANGIERFDLVVCNLYPFRATASDPSSSQSEIIEHIDIGGPAMIRAAAKNFERVAVVVSPARYDQVAEALESGGLDEGMRRELAAEAFFHTASYDAAIVDWIGDDKVVPLRRVQELRYGENPHQPAALYAEDGAAPWWLQATQHQGKEMSFNNYADTEAAWRLADDLGRGAAVVVKHTNAAGAAVAPTTLDSFLQAWDGDPLAAFGGVVAINGTLDRATAGEIADKFIEVVIALSVEDDAHEILSAKKNLRVLTAPAPLRSGLDFRRVDAGFLAQDRDQVSSDSWEVVTERSPTRDEMTALRFAWAVCANTKSNAIVIANGSKAVGVGAGDQSRVGAAERAVIKAGDRAKGGVAASDAFFPFRDGLDALVEAGVTAVAQPGGSRNDREVIDAADESGVAMVFTGRRHFRH